MNLYRIKFTNDGVLVNPSIVSPSFIEARNEHQALKIFLECCATYKPRELNPNNIKIKKIVNMPDIINRKYSIEV